MFYVAGCRDLHSGVSEKAMGGRLSSSKQVRCLLVPTEDAAGLIR